MLCDTIFFLILLVLVHFSSCQHLPAWPLVSDVTTSWDVYLTVPIDIASIHVVEALVAMRGESWPT